MLLKSAKKKSVFKLNLPVPASIRHASGFTLVPRSALGILATKQKVQKVADSYARFNEYVWTKALFMYTLF